MTLSLNGITQLHPEKCKVIFALALSIEESPLYPEWNIYYLITLHSGTGTSWSPGIGEEHALQTIKSVIRKSAEMYELSMIEGFSDIEDVEIFFRNCV